MKRKQSGTTRRSFVQGGLGIGVVSSLTSVLGAGNLMAEPAPEFDLVVVGSGAAGMTAALRAAHNGLKVLVIEKSKYFGGSTARSGGGIWIRNNSINQAEGIADSPALAKQYLSLVAGSEVSIAKQHAFIDAGPAMIDFVKAHSPLEFRYMEGYSDYYPEFPGAKPEGASIEPKVLDGRLLGDNLNTLNPPYIPTPPGVVVYGGDYKWLTLATVSKEGFATAARSVGRFASTRLKGEIPLTMGQALAAGLRVGLDKAKVPLWLDTSLQSLTVDDQGRVHGVLVQRDQKEFWIKANKGVLIASGGFEHNAEMRNQFQKQPINTEWTVGASSNTGDGIRLGAEIGADLELMDDAWWGPSVPLPNDDAYFCLSERSLPGSILVSGEGQRFTNESGPYHDVVNDMYRFNVQGDQIPTWLITDQNYRNRYLFRDVLPALPLPTSWYEAGSVYRSWSLRRLANKIDVPSDSLKATIKRFNSFAERGEDLDFGRGSNAYDRYYSDPGVTPNPSLGALTKPPYYAFRIVPGDLGTKGGLATNEFSQVLDWDRQVIPGLYSAGNASGSVMGRSYAGAGSTLGPAMAFGYIAADHVSESF